MKSISNVIYNSLLKYYKWITTIVFNIDMLMKCDLFKIKLESRNKTNLFIKNYF